jgi:hypothetical protein
MRRTGLLAAAAALLLVTGNAGASSIVELIGGDVSVQLAADESVAIGCDSGSIAFVPAPAPAVSGECSAVQTIEVLGGTGANTIDLSGVAPPDFALPADAGGGTPPVFVDCNGGEDDVTGTAFRDTIVCSSGVVNAGDDDDVVIVPPNGSVDADCGAGGDVLVVSGGADADTFALGAGTAGGSTHSGCEDVAAFGDDGADRFEVAGTGGDLQLNGDEGADTYVLQWGALGGTVRIVGDADDSLELSTCDGVDAGDGTFGRDGEHIEFSGVGTLPCSGGGGATAPELSIGDASVTEGDGGTVLMSFLVTLSERSASDVTFSFSTEGMTAGSPDFTNTSGTGTIPAGQLTTVVQVSVIGDTQNEADETLNVQLSGASVGIDDALGIGTIVDDDRPTVSISGDATDEGDLIGFPPPSLQFRIFLSEATDVPVTVTVELQPGTATEGVDYHVPESAIVVTIPAGETVGAFNVGQIPDLVDEDDETFDAVIVSATNADVDPDGDRDVGAIRDDDTTAISIGSATTVEGTGGTTTVVVPVTLSAPSTRTVSVAARTLVGSAVSADFEHLEEDTIVTFLPGETSKFLTLRVVGDSEQEGSETFTVELFDPANATIGTGTGTVTISDDDVPATLPSVSIDDQTVTEGDSGQRTVVFRVSLSAPPGAGQTASVRVRTTPGTADTGDTVFVDEIVSFVGDETERFVTVLVNGDREFEGDETALLTLSDPEGATIAGPLGRLTIVNDDRSPYASLGTIVDSPGCHANQLAPNDDSSTGAVSIGFGLNFFGTTYDSLFVNNNGNVTFDSPLGTFTPFPLLTTDRPIIAPAFGDVDTRPLASGVVEYGTTTHNGRAAFCVIWGDVGYFSSGTNRLNAFQLLLVDRSDSMPGDFDMLFLYDSVEWEAGSASGGSGGLGGSPLRVGYSNGDDQAFELPGSGVVGAFLDSNAATGLVHNSRGGLGVQPGTYVFDVRNGTPPAGGELSGLVRSAPGSLALSGATVQVCPSTGRCHTRTTNDAGRYAFSALPEGDWTVRALPPAGSSLAPATGGPVSVASGSPASLDLELTGPTPPPPGATITSIGTGAGGIPTLYWSSPITITRTACPGASAASFEIFVQGTLRRSGSMAEGPSGVYTGHADPLIPSSGAGEVRIHVTCPGGAVEDTSFNVYIDPSGFVRTTSGDPIVGATVTLFRSDDPGGPFTLVPDGSAIMSPSNRTNPDTTDGDGHFGWDVIAGYYKVRAEMAGCTSAETHVMTIPPPVTDLDIRLDCGGGAPGGGSSTTGSAGTATPQPTVQPTPPVVVPEPEAPAPNVAPRLARAGGPLAPPARAVRRGAFRQLVASFTVSEAAALRIEVRDGRTGRLVALQPGSTIDEARIGRRRLGLVYGVRGEDVVAVRFRFAASAIRPGRGYKLIVRAVDAEGARALLVIRFRG